jgi:hypothetical protein
MQGRPSVAAPDRRTAPSLVEAGVATEGHPYKENQVEHIRHSHLESNIRSRACGR